METLKSIKKRRSIRKFKPDDVNKNLIEDILNCGRLAPSAKNKQPWYFVMLEKETKNEVANLMSKHYLKYRKKLKEKKRFGYNSSVLETVKVIKEAPVLILVFRKKDDNWIVGDNLSIGACVENMCLRATDLGLGTLWIRDTVYASNEISKFLGYEMELNCALAIGYANENPRQRPRKKLNEIVDWLR